MPAITAGEQSPLFRIAHYTDERINDPRGGSPLPWVEFQRVRNSVLAVCKRFGSVGAMDTCPIDLGLDEQQTDEIWETTKEFFPTFFVVDDQLNDERYVYVEVLRKYALNEGWLGEISLCLSQMPGWGVCVSNVVNGYIIIFPGLILVNGPALERAKTLRELVEAGQSKLSLSDS